jgi:hypothetical protein
MYKACQWTWGLPVERCNFETWSLTLRRVTHRTNHLHEIGFIKQMLFYIEGHTRSQTKRLLRNCCNTKRSRTKKAVFWVVARALMMKAASISEMSVLPDYRAQQPRRQPSSYSPPWEPENSLSRTVSYKSSVIRNAVVEVRVASDILNNGQRRCPIQSEASFSCVFISKKLFAWKLLHATGFLCV